MISELESTSENIEIQQSKLTSTAESPSRSPKQITTIDSPEETKTHQKESICPVSESEDDGEETQFVDVIDDEMTEEKEMQSLKPNDDECEKQKDKNDQVIMRPKAEFNEVDILSKIFPKEKRAVLELVLTGCQGDLLRAVEHFLSVNEAMKRGPNSTTPQPQRLITQSKELNSSPPCPSPPNSKQSTFFGGIKSAFTPLTSNATALNPFLPEVLPPTARNLGGGPLYSECLGTGPHVSTSNSLLPTLGTNGYPPLFPHILPVIPPFPLSRPSYMDPPCDVQDRDLTAEFLSNRNSMMDYRARIDLLSRPEMRLGLDVRPEIRLRSPSGEDS